MKNMKKGKEMNLGHRFTGRALLSAAFVVPVLSVGGLSHHAQAKALDTQVIAVYDATAQSHCKMWNGDDVTHSWSGAAGSVIYSNPETLVAAQAAGHRYVIPTSDTSATRKAIDAVARDLSGYLLEQATTVSKFGPQYGSYLRHVTSGAHLLNRPAAPAVAMGCPVGATPTDTGSYNGNGGGTIFYKVAFTVGGGTNGAACTVYNVKDADAQSQPANTPLQFWDYSVVGGSGNQGHGCQSIPTNGYTGFDNEPNGSYNDRYENHAANGGNCTIFDGDSYGFRALT